MSTFSNVPLSTVSSTTTSTSTGKNSQQGPTAGSAARSEEEEKKSEENADTMVQQPQPRKRARFTAAALTEKKKNKNAAILRSEDFAVMESPHPYGILPEGNRFFDFYSTTTSSSSRSQKTVAKNQQQQCPSTLISDEGWYHVLEFCNHCDLGRVLQTCRYFYAVGSEPELWRDLVLRMNKTITLAGPTWKDTLVKLLYYSSNNVCSTNNFQPHVPMRVRGVYSDSMYRLHSCRSFAIPPSWRDASTGTVPRVPWQEMTVERFERDYEQRNAPVVIVGAATSWKAFEQWQNMDYFLEKTKDRSFRATSGAAALPGHFTMPAYLEYCNSTCLEEAPLYLFDRTALKPESPLWKDYMYDLQRTCPYFDPTLCSSSSSNNNNNTTSTRTHHDLFQVLGEGARPDHTWMILGPRRSGSVFHIDPNATHAWNASIVGSKFWILYPPGVTPPGVHPSSDGDEVALPLSLGEWIFQFWDEHEKRKQQQRQSEEELCRPMECTTLAGDVMFVPHGWWHLVVNLDELNIAITHNYASASNLSSVFKFLKEKRDQVSGCRDRPESIKPERLYEEFVTALQKQHPELVKRALEDPNWACRAWSTTTTNSTTSGEETSKKSINATTSSRSASAPASSFQGHGSSVMSKAKSGSFGSGGDGESGGFSFSFL